MKNRDPESGEVASSRRVVFQHADAQRLADLTGVAHDLLLVDEYCEHFFAHDREASRKEMIVCRSLFIAAAVGYCRTIGSSVRSGVTKQQIDQLSPNLQNAHQHFKDVRDKYVAHSVNAFEESHVNVLLAVSESGASSVASIGNGHNELATPSPLLMVVLQDLAQHVLAIVKDEMERERTKLYEIAKRLPIEYFSNAPEPAPSIRLNKAPSITRNKIGKKTAARKSR